MDSVKSRRSRNIEKHQSWAHESIMNPEQVDEKLQGLYKLIEEEIVPTHPHRAELLKEIVQDWGDLKKKHLTKDALGSGSRKKTNPDYYYIFINIFLM